MGLRDEYALAVREGFRTIPPDACKTLTEDGIAALPVAVQRYMRFAGAIGRPRIWNYQLRFRGELRNGADSPWMRIEADQQSFVEPATRLFFIKASMFGVPFRTLHRYVGPSATFKVSSSLSWMRTGRRWTRARPSPCSTTCACSRPLP